MSNITQKTDYSTGLALLLSQYKETNKSVKLRGVIDASYDQADDLEQALFEIRDEFWLADCVGDQLDVIGEIFQVFRDGDVDAAYRIRIQAKASLVASGTPEDIISILKNIFGATFVTYIFVSSPAPPAAYYVLTDGVVTTAQLIKYSPAGVQPNILYGLEYEDGDDIEYEDSTIMYAVE